MDNLDFLFTVIGTILSVLSVPQLFGQTWNNVLVKLFRGGISWKEVEKLTSNVLSQMKNDDQPDLIIGVGRGGIISAGLLCSALTNDGTLASQNSQSKNITIETVNTIRKPLVSSPQLKGRVVSYPLLYEVQKIDFSLKAWEGKSILVVIGETVTGKTLLSMKEKIKEKIVEECKVKGLKDLNINVKYATLALHDTRHNNSVDKSIQIDYIGDKYKRHIIMPWKH